MVVRQTLRGNPSLDRGNLSLDRGSPSDQGSQGISSANQSMSLKDMTKPRSSHQVVYHKDHPTLNAVGLYVTGIVSKA